LDEIQEEPFRVDLGGVDQHVEVRRMHDAPLPPAMAAQIADETAPAGDLAYWIRVRQEDGAVAWSSPIFVRLTR